MENTGNRQCEMKTDLNLLLECLKYQMDQPTSQKEALVTVYSVCHQNSGASDYFREIGGLMFVNNLVKSSVHSIVKEAALFTLGGLAETSVFCQEILCTSRLFEDLHTFLTQKNSSVNLKRMSVYVLLVLVSNNKSGQTYVRECGCLDVLLQLFRTTLSVSEVNLSDNNNNLCYQLWSSVCSALCACVNNPQNEDNQKSCSLVFPYAKDCLQHCTKPEVVRPICSFIGLTLASNSRLQQFFVSIGGLAVLDELLAKLICNSSGNSSTKLAVVVTKTLDACIADNYAIGATLARYNIVPNLLTLLSYNKMNSGEKFSIILTLGHCTDGCEENQYILVKNNGLPLMIQALTESQDEELNKAATFVLQNCKRITEKLSVKLSEYPSNVEDAGHLEADLQRREGIIEDYREKAKQILYRIEQLENENLEFGGGQQGLSKREGLGSAQAEEGGAFLPDIGDVVGVEVEGQPVRVALPGARFGGVEFFQRPPGRHLSEVLRLWCVKVKSASERLFKQPDFVMKNATRQVPRIGCITGRLLNSRNFCKILQSCQHLCEQHKVILQTEMKYKSNLKRSITSHKDCSTDYKVDLQAKHDTFVERQASKQKYNPENASLGENHTFSFDEVEDTEIRSADVPAPAFKNSQRRIRKDFTSEEINYLLDGVKRKGHHWNAILWAYPFQKGRTNVDLAKKYSKLQRSKKNKNI
uniref:telomere repeats-binding bouquet formation protein 1 n=1 Tax=Euleptes europaea TaxID=460621 RepID=UPI002541B0F3|nr:telomere repeats-binding bouquet formation protein 1 [Euleptes europaea]